MRFRTEDGRKRKKEKGFEKERAIQFSHTPLSEEIMVGSLCLFAD